MTSSSYISEQMIWRNEKCWLISRNTIQREGVAFASEALIRGAGQHWATKWVNLPKQSSVLAYRAEKFANVKLADLHMFTNSVRI